MPLIRWMGDSLMEVPFPGLHPSIEKGGFSDQCQNHGYCLVRNLIHTVVRNISDYDA